MYFLKLFVGTRNIIGHDRVFQLEGYRDEEVLERLSFQYSNNHYAYQENFRRKTLADLCEPNGLVSRYNGKLTSCDGQGPKAR